MASRTFISGDGDRIDHDAELVTLDAGHFTGLGVGGQVLVDDPDAASCAMAMARRDSVTVSMAADKRDVQGDVARQARGQGSVARQDLGIRRHQQHIVEGERFLYETHG